MKEVVLVSGENNYARKRIIEESSKLDISITDYWDIRDEVDYVATFNRRSSAALMKYQRGRQINDLVKSIFWRDKINQLICLENVCRVPKFMLGKGLSYELVSNVLDVPFIAKMSNSCQGKGVFLVRNYEDFKLASNCDVFEEVIWNSLGKDVRVFCINGEVKRCMLRVNQDNFKSNFHQGGRGTNYEISDEIKQIAKSIYDVSKLDIIN